MLTICKVHMQHSTIVEKRKNNKKKKNMGKPYLFFIYKLKLVTLDNIYSYMHSHKIIESLSMLHLYSMFLTWLQGCYTCTQGRRTQ